MLNIPKELRDQITSFLGGLQVPVSAAPNFLVIIEALSTLKEAPPTEDKPE